ncbi:MAG: FtsH protease activity modulator HflK [Christensenellales bacterium]
MKTKIKWILWGIAALLVLGILGGGFYRIDEGCEGLVLTFGEITQIKAPGLYWRIPFVQSVASASTTEIVTKEYGFRTTLVGTTSASSEYTDVPEEAIMITGDGNIVRVEAVYQVVVKDVASYLYNVDDPLGTIHRAFETVLRRNIQNRTLDDALLNKQDIETQVLPDFSRLCDHYEVGLEVREVLIQNITVPDEVSAAYEDVNNALNEKTQKLDEAEKYANQIVPAARAEAYNMVQEAEAYKAETVAWAQAEVSVFNQIYAKYLLSPGITRRRLKIEALEAILGNADAKFIISADGGEMLQLLPLTGETAAEGGDGNG